MFVITLTKKILIPQFSLKLHTLSLSIFINTTDNSFVPPTKALKNIRNLHLKYDLRQPHKHSPRSLQAHSQKVPVGSTLQACWKGGPPISEILKTLNVNECLVLVLCLHYKDVNLGVIFWTIGQTFQILERSCLHICQKLIRKHPLDNTFQHGPTKLFKSWKRISTKNEDILEGPLGMWKYGWSFFQYTRCWMSLLRRSIATLPGDGARVIHDDRTWPCEDHPATVSCCINSHRQD
jgi:hypothetical protein